MFLSTFNIRLFQPVLHDWCYPVCGMMHINKPLLLIGKSSLCGSSGFLSRYRNGPLPYAWRHITVNKMCWVKKKNPSFPSIFVKIITPTLPLFPPATQRPLCVTTASDVMHALWRKRKRCGLTKTMKLKMGTHLLQCRTSWKPNLMQILTK